MRTHMFIFITTVEKKKKHDQQTENLKLLERYQCGYQTTLDIHWCTYTPNTQVLVM